MTRTLPLLLLAAVLLPDPAAASEVEVGVSLGGFDARVDHLTDFSAAILEFRAEGSLFKAGPGIGGRFRATFGLWDYDEEYYYYTDAEALDVTGIDAQVLAGWTFPLDPELRLTPVVGLGYRNYHTEYRPYGTGERVEYDFDMLSLDFGLRLDFTPPEAYAIGGNLQFTVGPVLAGRTREDSDSLGRLEGEVESGLVFECRASACVDLLAVGVAYEYVHRTLGGELDRHEEHQRFAFWIGLGLPF